MLTGIIAEFNPLHLGHESLMRFAKSLPNSEGVIVILSSNFTQRGSASIVDKFSRASMAVMAGADLVIELPFLYACSAGQDFSRGTVEILGRLGCVSRVAFGMENPEFDAASLADVMAREPEGYREILRREIGRGASFPKAVSIALEEIFAGSRDFITRPNNMLAVSYMAGIIRGGWKIEAVPFLRRRLSENPSVSLREPPPLDMGGKGNIAPPEKGERASLLARGVVFGHSGRGEVTSRAIREDINGNSHMMPEYSREILEDAKREGRLSDEGRLWPLLQGVFIRSGAEELRGIYGIDEGIEGLFLKHWKDSRGLEDFVGRCVCARYTRAHIRRRIVYILLGLKRDNVREAMNDAVPYARVLAFNERGREILRMCRKTSRIPIITRLKDAEGATGKFFAETEYRASQLYELTVDKHNMSRETQKVLQFP